MIKTLATIVTALVVGLITYWRKGYEQLKAYRLERELKHRDRLGEKRKEWLEKDKEDVAKDVDKLISGPDA